MAKKTPKPPKAVKAKITITQKSGKIVVYRFNSKDSEASTEALANTFEELKAGSRILIEPSHVDELPVAVDAYLEYLFSYNSGEPGDFIQYRSIAASTEEEARTATLCDELWILLATSTPAETDYKTFTGTTPIV